ncbi:hypothetical protein DFH06DRAFT_1349244 [Mycena polygramma]|nr:hypothetical protein DFH06DRAFT_1349244 [Mycena polygramma]
MPNTGRPRIDDTEGPPTIVHDQPVTFSFDAQFVVGNLQFTFAADLHLKTNDSAGRFKFGSVLQAAIVCYPAYVIVCYLLPFPDASESFNTYTAL